MWQYRWTVFLLNQMGITVVGFDFAWKKAIRECGFEDFINFINQVNQSVDDVITQSSTKVQFSVLGLSFGSVLALYSAKRHESIKSIILFVLYGTLSHLLWTHKPSRPFIETLIQDGLKSEEELEALTQPVETQYQLDRLKGRKIISFLGKSDKIVFDGEKLIDAIKKQNIDATFFETRFGHLGTSVIGILQKRKWDNIL